MLLQTFKLKTKRLVEKFIHWYTKLVFNLVTMSKHAVVLWEIFAANYLHQTFLKFGHYVAESTVYNKTRQFDFSCLQYCIK